VKTTQFIVKTPHVKYGSTKLWLLIESSSSDSTKLPLNIDENSRNSSENHEISRGTKGSAVLHAAGMACVLIVLY
jgi:hypothetical protein